MNIADITKETSLVDIINDNDFEEKHILDVLDEMTFEQTDAIFECIGDFSLPHRIALLLIYAAAGDKVITQKEFDEALEIFKNWCDATEVHFDVVELWNEAIGDFNTNGNARVLETATIFKEHFPIPTLNNIIHQMAQVASGDDLANDEEKAIKDILMFWYGKIGMGDLKAKLEK